jgi:hypothetical protein
MYLESFWKEWKEKTMLQQNFVLQEQEMQES